MPSLFADLVGMDLRSLASWLRTESNTADLGQQEVNGVVEAFTSRLVGEAETIAAHEWEGFAEANDAALLMAGLDHTGRAIRRINLMRALIAAVGPSPDYSLRNPNTAVAELLGALPMEFDEASARALNWRQESREDMRRLRSIKNLLTPLVGTVDLISDPAGRESLGRWMTLVDQLP